MVKVKTTKADNETLEQKLWKSADKLRKNMDAAEYKHVVLGLIFLKYISDSFDELYQKLVQGEGDYQGANPEDKDEYLAENVFFVPENARWSYLQAKAKQPEIGKFVDEAMIIIETENPQLKGILPKVYAQQKLDKASLGSLIDLIGSCKLVKDEKSNVEQLDLDLEQNASKLKGDVLGQVYEYFLGEFALLEGRKGGQFYTPESIVKLLVIMIEPYSGRVFDPCCGSGGMFVWSEKFIEAHQGKADSISIYGQESNETTWRLCKMNLAIRGIDTSQIRWNNEGSFLNDAHPDLKADFILANPPFNDSDWGGELLQSDGRWVYGKPSVGNANFAWVQHFIYHLSPTGSAGFVLSNGSLSSNTGSEGEVRQKLVEADLVDCIVMLPTQLFYNTGIPACLWFISRYKNGNKNRSRKGEVLFIDTSEMGEMINRRNRILTDDDINKIADTYHQWKLEKGHYKDIKGFCKSATIEDIKKHNFVLAPGRYVGGREEKKDGIPFQEKMTYLNQSLKEITKTSREIDNEIRRKLILTCPYLNWDNIDFSSSEVLEYIMQNLYKHWFIDFDFPNEEGKPYKSSGGAMCYSELGDIPTGWKVGKLGDIARNYSQTHQFKGKEKIIFINTGDVLEGHFLHHQYTSVDTLPGQAKKMISKDDILYSEIRPINKRFAYVTFNSDDYIVSTKFMVIKANELILPRLLYLILKLPSTVQEFNAIAESRSGTFPQITFDSVSNLVFPLPDIETQKRLVSIILPLMEKQEFNVEKIQSLTKNLELLSPK